jgi:sugar phosphate permease
MAVGNRNARYRWTILAVGATAQSTFSALMPGIAVLAPALRARYGLTLGETGVVIGANTLGSTATLLAWGLLADRVGERVVIALGLGASAGALVGAAYAPGFGVLVLCLAGAGLAGASVNAASGRAVMGWFPPAQRGLALGIRQTSVPLGGAAAALALPAIETSGGVRTALLALAGFTAFGALAGAYWMREPPLTSGEELGGLHPVRDRRIWTLSTGSALLVCAQIGLLGFLVLFLHAERGLSTAAAAGVLASIQIGGGAARIGFGYLSDRVGSRLTPLRAIAAGIAVALALTAALLAAPLAALVPALVVAGVLSQSWNGLSFATAAELAGRARSGAALGFQQTALGIAGATTPIALAQLVGASSWRVGFAALAACPLAGLAFLYRLESPPEPANAQAAVHDRDREHRGEREQRDGGRALREQARAGERDREPGGERDRGVEPVARTDVGPARRPSGKERGRSDER